MWLTLIESSRFYVGFPGISRLGSAFTFLLWFQLAHTCMHSLHSTGETSKKSMANF